MTHTEYSAASAGRQSKKMTDFSALTIGVLELQGDFAEHSAMLRRCGVGKVVGIRQVDDLDGIDGMVFPGGESTTIAKLLERQDMLQPIQHLAYDGMPMFGTCAGCILLASEIRHHPKQPGIRAMDIVVDRNAYGAQIDSFETFVESPLGKMDGEPLRVVQIRAPMITKVKSSAVKVLASYNNNPILVQQGNKLACTFHPELTKDMRVHQLFLRIVQEQKKQTNM